MNHYGRKLRTALGIAALSGTAAVGAGILGQGYERGVTGYDPAAAEKERVEYTKRQRASVEDRRGTIEKGLDWIKQVGSVRSTEDLAKLSDTYTAMHQQYNALLGLIDDASFWLPFILTFYAMAKTLTVLYNAKKGSRVDPDVEVNQQRLANAVNTIGLRLHELQAGTITADDLRTLVAAARQAGVDVSTLEGKLGIGK